MSGDRAVRRTSGETLKSDDQIAKDRKRLRVERLSVAGGASLAAFVVLVFLVQAILGIFL